MGHEYRGPPETMLDKLNRSLNNTLLWAAEDGDPDYEYKAVGDLRKQFGGAPAARGRYQYQYDDITCNTS